MGKRKFDGESDVSLKKSKNAVPAEDSENDPAEQPQKSPNKSEKRGNTGVFDVKHFRKELASKQGQTMVLTQFLQVCLNPDNHIDYLIEYLKSGGNSHEILRQITPENKKNLTLTTPVFHLFHLVILKVQSSLPHMIPITEEACRYFLNNFMSTVEIMISENSGPRHRKIILKLLTSMVTLSPDLGIEVLSHAPLTPKHLQYIVDKTNYKEKDNVRTSFVHFMTSFLVDGHLPLVKALLEKQGLLALVIPGLVHDEAEAVLMFLNILKKNVIENTFITKSLKLKTFSHQVLHNMFKLFSWKGPPEVSNEAKNELRPEIMTLLSDIILTLFTSHKLGLYFTDNSMGTGDINKNQNLYKALTSLKRPWENEYECQVILETVHKCPDLHRAVMNIVEQPFEPQQSPIWERTVTFTIKLLDKMNPESVVPRMGNLTPVQVANFVRFVTLPVPLLKFIQSNLGKDESISLHCIKVLVKMLQTLKRYMQILEVEDTALRISEVRNKLEYFVPKHLPAPTAIVSLINDLLTKKTTTVEKLHEYRLPKIQPTDALMNLADLLLLYNDVHPAFFEMLEGSIDMKQILQYSTSLTEGNIALSKFKIVSLWLTLDRSAISLKNSMFKELFLIMLEVYTNDEGDTWLEAKGTLYNFLKHTEIFEGDEDEIHLVLYTLRNTRVRPVSLIADIFEYIMSNVNELTALVRNQTVNFEIADKGSEASLNKLLDDLMENRSTKDSVFLENKVPSTFIVGCMQFIQMNKEAKKNLKHFLSLYIANLFHCNFSPELTEVLIGDSKLDVRCYITSWLTEPASLPDTITAQDNTLQKLSSSIIDGKDIPIVEIFPCLEERSEDSDIEINEIQYKVNLVEKVDRSEILIWAKYLIFCTVRLSVIDKLDEEKQKKITSYFDCIITVGKKMHLMGECRQVFIALLKNPHFLKIYSPLIVENCGAGILPTKFLLNIVTIHGDIVNYLDRKYRILKSYQQKNYNELVKAFIKIGKRKNFDSGHTVKVLQIIGLTNEDDLLVFGKIFGLDINYCVKENNEPSFVLDILQTLLGKYSKTATVESPQHVIRKSMKLYTELLVNRDVNADLTAFEDTLTRYFENKPNHCVYINDDIFKKFFDASSVRKSTSRLASMILQFNMKLCNVFKEQTLRPEILSQRELTLPLGNAVIYHKQFVTENKHFLSKVYEEYKSNINKTLEKPHKAGQVYVTCWKFIRKLILECMDVKVCQKLFGKGHKFEVAEISHIHLLQAAFLKTCLYDDCCNTDNLMNYLLSMLHITTIALKENKDIEILGHIARNVSDVLSISKSVRGLDVSKKEDFKKVTDSAIWQNFCKNVLKDSLKVRTANQTGAPGPRLLAVLTKLVKLFYGPDHEDAATLFDMVTSHSEFLNVMLSHHSPDIKSRLIELLYTLVRINGSVMKAQQIPVYLSSYRATRSPCDRLLLAILHFYESRGQPVNEYKPYVFGDSAANHYAVRKSRTSSLWGHPTPNRILSLFDREVTERTVKNFPVAQRLDYHYELPDADSIGGSTASLLAAASRAGAFRGRVGRDTEEAVEAAVSRAKWESLSGVSAEVAAESHRGEDEGAYDPAFVLPVLGHLLAPGSAASCLKLLRTGLLSVALAALAARCPGLRAAAYHVLHRFCLLLETETRHKKDKLFLTDFINTLRQSLSTAVRTNGAGMPPALLSPRLPAVDALYLAKALMVATAPGDPLYKPVSNFFIAKQLVDLTVVPDFLTLFHDSDVESSERRMWILDIIRYGTKTMVDIDVVLKTMCLKMIMDFYSSVLCDRKVKDRILNVVNSVISVPRACEILLEGYGLMSWLHAVVRQLRGDDRLLVKSMFSVIENMIHSLRVNAFAKNLTVKNGSNARMELKIKNDVEDEVLHVLYELLQHTDGLEVEDLTMYVQMYNGLSYRAVKSLSKKDILTLIGKCGVSYRDNEIIKLLTKTIVSNDGNIMKSKSVNSLLLNDPLLKELAALTSSYII